MVGWTATLLLAGVLAMGWAGWLPDWPLFADRTPPAPSEQPAPLAPRVALPEQAAGPTTAPTAGPTPPGSGGPSPAPTSTPPGPATTPPPPASAGPTALRALNQVRALAHLPAVAWQPDWAAQCAEHARYLVRADRAEHREDPLSPYRTAQGEACAQGHYFVSAQPDSAALRALAYWATGAFHLPQLLDPRLRQVALGEAHDQQGAFESAVVLDVRRGLSPGRVAAGQAPYPVRFPAPASQSPYREAAQEEWPDPLPGCGYAAPAGAPVALLLGPGGEVQEAALKVNGQPVAACLLSAAHLQGTQPGASAVSRGVLSAQGAGVLLPRQPLPPGARVQVSFRTAAGRVGWSFRVVSP